MSDKPTRRGQKKRTDDEKPTTSKQGKKKVNKDEEGKFYTPQDSQESYFSIESENADEPNGRNKQKSAKEQERDDEQKERHTVNILEPAKTQQPQRAPSVKIIEDSDIKSTDSEEEPVPRHYSKALLAEMSHISLMDPRLDRASSLPSASSDESGLFVSDYKSVADPNPVEPKPILKISSQILNAEQLTPIAETRRNIMDPRELDKYVKQQVTSPSALGQGHDFIYMIIPPDGGYGWFIVCISFLFQCIIDGIISAIGCVMPDMQNDLNLSDQEISFIPSILVGPFSCAFLNKYGFRRVATTGAGVSFISLLISTFSQDITMLIIFYSVIAGTFFSMIWVSSQLIIGYYFDKNRPIATGLSCSGAGAGMVVFTILNSNVITQLGWRNLTYIHSGCILLILLLSWSFAEVAPTKIGQIIEPDRDLDTDSSSESDEIERLSQRFTLVQSMIYLHPRIDEILESYEKEPEKKKNICLRMFIACCPKIYMEINEQRSDRSEVQNGALIVRPTAIEKLDLFYTGPELRDTPQNQPELQAWRNSRFSYVEKYASAKQINYQLSMVDTSKIVHQEKRTLSELRSENKKYPIMAFISPMNWVHPKIINALRKLFDLNLLQMLEFQILFACSFFFAMGINVPIVYSLARAELPILYATLIPIVMGFSNFLLRILSGYVAQKFIMQAHIICGGGIFIGGVCAFISAFFGANLLWFQLIYATSFGCASATYSTLRAVIYVRTLGLEKLTNAFGLSTLAMAVGVFIGTSLGGFCIQQTGHYSLSFVISGVALMLSGSLMIMLIRIIHYSQQRNLTDRKVQFE